MKYLLIALFLSSLAYSGLCVTKELQRYEFFCVYRTLPEGDELSGNYIASGINEKSVGLQVLSPTNKFLTRIEREREGSFVVQTNETGEFRTCFRNYEKDPVFISFEIHSNLTEANIEAFDSKQLGKVDERLVEVLDELKKVTMNQRFEEMRGRIHTITMDYLDSKMQWSTFFKVLALMAIGAGQVYILQGFFKKKIRVSV